MKDEVKSMKDNGVWDLVELPEGVNLIGCKWIFKTKRDSKGNIVRYKACLVAISLKRKTLIIRRPFHWFCHHGTCGSL